jgi:cytochrome bd-type quinol oxidase subunit 2
MNDISSIMRIHSSLGTFWWILLGLFFVIYIILDGADLGAGVFSLLLCQSASKFEQVSASNFEQFQRGRERRCL